jgi:hypothetical protein
VTERTHYIGYGISLSQQQVNDFFKQDSDIVEKIYDDYDDNPYKEEVTKTKSGLTIVVDGMNGKYIFFGKIVQKALDYDGLDFTVFEEIDEKNKEEVVKEASKIFDFIVTKSDVKNIVFTHWH